MKFIVNDRTIKADGETIISYNLDYMAEFEFDPEWSDKIITARFVLTNGNYYDVILEDNKCQIPLFKKGLVALGVYTDEFTSTYVTLSVHSSIKDLGNNEVIPPSEDVYQQIIRMIEEGKVKGDKGDPGEDYVITESDYQAIADRVPQPDLTDYVKNTDYASDTKAGIVKSGVGITVGVDGAMCPIQASNTTINNRVALDDYSTTDNNRRPITASHLDYAVKQAMCDGKGASWTDAEQLSARQRLGVEKEWTKVQKVITEADVVDGEPPYVLFNIPKDTKEILYNFAIKRTDASACNINLNMSNAAAWSARSLWTRSSTDANITYRGHSNFDGRYVITDYCSFQNAFITESLENTIPNRVLEIYSPKSSAFNGTLYLHCVKGIAVGSELTLWYR